MKSKSDTKPNYDYLVYDTETTGLNVESDKIAEISGLHLASVNDFIVILTLVEKVNWN